MIPFQSRYKNEFKEHEMEDRMRIAFCMVFLLVLVFIPCTAARGPQTSGPEPALQTMIESKLDLGNPNVEQTAVTIARDYPGEFSINQAGAIYNSLVQGWSYYSDPNFKESYKNANLSLQDGLRAGTVGVGDCDDFAILIASLIESLGGSTRIIFSQDEETGQGHAYAELYLGNCADSQLLDLKRWIQEEYGISSTPGLIPDDEGVWLNLDYNSSYPGGPFFGGEKANRKTAWMAGNKTTPKIISFIDSMDNLSGWEVVKDDIGSNASLSLVPLRKGNTIQLSCNLKEGGWAGISKEIDSYSLSQAAGLNFSYFMKDKQNTIKLRLVCDDDSAYEASWTNLKTDAWQSQKKLYTSLKYMGPEINSNLTEKFSARKVRQLEIIIYNDPSAGDEAGRGTVIFDKVRGLMAIPAGSPWERVEQQRHESTAFNLAAQSSDAVRGSSGDSLFQGILLAVESLRHNESVIGYTTLRNELALLPRPIFQLKHHGIVYVAIFSPDGTKLATASEDQTARIWDVQTGAELQILKHNGSVTKIAFSQDGTKLATVCDDKTARIWEVLKGKELFSINYSSALSFSPDFTKIAEVNLDGTVIISDVQSGKARFTLNNSAKVNFSPDGMKLACAYNDGNAGVFDLITGRELYRQRHGGTIDMIAFTQDGTKLVTVSNMDRITDKSQHNIHIWDANTGRELQSLDDNTARFIVISQNGAKLATVSDMEGLTIRVWDVRTGEEIHRLTSDSSVNMMAFSPDGTKLAFADLDNKVSIWLLLTSKEMGRFYHGPISEDYDGVEFVAFSPDGTKLVTASDDGSARIWETRTNPGLLDLEHNSSVNRIAFNSNGSELATASYDGTARIWDHRTGREIQRLENDGAVYFLAFSPDGTKLATWSEYGNDRIWDAQTGKELYRLNDSGPVVFSLEGSYLAVAGSDGMACICDVRSGKELQRLIHGKSLNCVAFNPNGTRLASGSDDNTARIWDVQTGQELQRLQMDDDVNSVEFSPDGSKLAAASDDGTARIWEVQTGKELQQLDHGSWVGSVAFNPDGRMLATSCWGNTARIWDINTGKELQELNHDDIVSSVAFSPDGTKLATASDDGTARIWDAKTGIETQRLNHGDWVKNAVFSPDGNELATACWDGTARIWLVSKEELINKTCDCLTSNMTRTQWNSYLPDGDRITCPREGGSNACMPCIESLFRPE
jgi:WD40 repeat protein